MHTRFKRAKISFFIILALIATSAWAWSCRESCTEQYQATLRVCKANYGQTDQEDLQEKSAQILSDCIEDAKNTYQDCLRDCQG